MTVAAETRAAVDRRPFLRAALGAGVVSYAAAAARLDIDGDEDAVATALRRYAAELPDPAIASRDARVRMRSGIAVVEGSDGTEALLSVGAVAVADGGSGTAVIAVGDVGATALARALERLRIEGVEPAAAGVAGETMVVVVDRADGADAVRTVEAVLSGM